MVEAPSRTHWAWYHVPGQAQHGPGRGRAASAWPWGEQGKAGQRREGRRVLRHALQLIGMLLHLVRPAAATAAQQPPIAAGHVFQKNSVWRTAGRSKRRATTPSHPPASIVRCLAASPAACQSAAGRPLSDSDHLSTLLPSFPMPRCRISAFRVPRAAARTWRQCCLLSAQVRGRRPTQGSAAEAPRPVSERKSSPENLTRIMTLAGTRQNTAEVEARRKGLCLAPVRAPAGGSSHNGAPPR